MNVLAPARQRPGNDFAQGIIMMLCGVLPLPIMDGIGKYLATAGTMAPGQTTFYRFFFQFALTAPVLLLLGGRAALRPRQWWPNLLRGALLGASSLAIFTAVKYMPLADTIAIFFVEPFILTAFSALFLRERVGWPQWLAIATGFLGALIVINPSFSRFGVVAVLPLVSAAMFASYMLLNRALGRRDSPLTMQYAAGIGGSLLLGLALLGGGLSGSANFLPSLPATKLAWLLVLCIGAISAYCHLLIVAAFQKIPASILAPLQYLEIVSASIIGYLVFNDFPSPTKLFGIAVIVLSGLFIFWRQERP
ncbi:MAG TPA: DMT family transporter [Salinisphaeraceae bacterium]|nr:DMT family transporter [Salinisphaeraceae bacterium]